MLNEIQSIVSSLNVLSSGQVSLISAYLMGLMVTMKKHSFEAIGQMTNYDPSGFSAVLNKPETLLKMEKLFNRALRRRLAKLKFKKGKSFIIIDATLTKRTGKCLENVHTYHSGSSYVRGHKWINMILVHNEEVIPLNSIPILSKDFCKENGMEYRTESEIVTEWLEGLVATGHFSEKELSKIFFLLDSGYDCKAIQRTILKIGSNFVMALMSSRSVRKTKNPNQSKNWNVQQYFKRHKKSHKAMAIQFKGSGKQTRHFNVRLATGLLLNGVAGEVRVVCSKVKRGSKVTEKYLASSAPLKARDIVKYYRFRWLIETWHKEVKQKFGFGDNACRAFHAVYTHVQLLLLAYLLRSMAPSTPRTIQEYEVKETALKLKRMTSVKRIKAYLDSLLEDKAA